MGGCRCVYRSCQSSTTQSPGLHYFHFPVRDPPRCDQWITNARKSSFRNLPKDKLRNKVICSLHFEQKCFTNEKHDRLIHNAIPTLGFESEEPIADFTVPTPTAIISKNDASIMLIPISTDNTKFALPHAGTFSGMSYTIYDDSVIPSSDLRIMNHTMDDNILVPNKKSSNEEIKLKQVSKRPKFTITSINKATAPPVAPVKAEPLEGPLQLLQEISVFSENNFFTVSPCKVPKQETASEVIQDLRAVNDMCINTSKIVTYSVSACGDDVTVEPSPQQPENIGNDEIITDFSTQSCDVENNIMASTIHKNTNGTPLLDNDVSLKLKSNNEYTMSVTPVSISTLPTNLQMTIEQENCKKKCTSKPKLTRNKEFNSMPEQEYIRLIQNNSKQIKTLKRLIQKQSKINRFMLQRRQMPRLKRRRINKVGLLECLKGYVKPSLLAILKLELLPSEDVVLTDNEEKFITDLYTENPECYNLLLKKWNWNLPTSNNFNDENSKQ